MHNAATAPKTIYLYTPRKTKTVKFLFDEQIRGEAALAPSLRELARRKLCLRECPT